MVWYSGFTKILPPKGCLTGIAITLQPYSGLGRRQEGKVYGARFGPFCEVPGPRSFAGELQMVRMVMSTPTAQNLDPRISLRVIGRRRETERAADTNFQVGTRPNAYRSATSHPNNTPLHQGTPGRKRPLKPEK